MNFFGKMTLVLAGGILLVATALADEATGNNPYAPIVARNVFGLNPPAPPAPAEPAEPPPKITPNGIMTILGNLQALFKVTVITPGKPAAEKSYMLTEGQREDDIEVTKIDEKNAVITFNNHGTIQELPLTPGQASGGSGTDNSGMSRMAIPTRPINPAFNQNRFGNNASLDFHNRTAVNNNQMNNNIPSSSGFGAGGYGNQMNSGQPMRSNLSPDDQAALIAAQHALAQQSGNPMAPIFPPTKYDQEAGLPPMPGQN